jgi:thiol-disulfide isomerase/thioredoxin
MKCYEWLTLASNLAMKKLLILLVLFAFSVHAQESGKPYARYKDGVTVYTYNFAQFEEKLKQQNDSVYVVNFWATWCAPCIKELPHFETIGARYKNKKVKVLLVSLDMNKQVENGLLSFIKRKKLQSEVIHLHEPDANAWISKVDPSWSGALPATVIYSKSGRKFYERSFTETELENEVKQFLIN